jgi:hypothetical protein
VGARYKGDNQFKVSKILGFSGKEKIINFHVGRGERPSSSCKKPRDFGILEANHIGYKTCHIEIKRCPERMPQELLLFRVCVCLIMGSHFNFNRRGLGCCVYIISSVFMWCPSSMGLRIHCPTQTLQCPLKVKVELRTSM